MGIFMGYVSLPEGSHFKSISFCKYPPPWVDDEKNCWEAQGTQNL